jgi:predicted TIM-barrel fold metal-dependent hydrolase
MSGPEGDPRVLSGDAGAPPQQPAAEAGPRPDLTVEPALLRWWRQTRAELAGGDADAVHVVDAHTHIGEHDPDTMRCSPAELLAHLEQSEANGVVFPLREPDGYPEHNDLVIATAAASNGRLTAFGRVDPARSPAQEARRVLDAGARGLKLHPRGEQFQLDDARLEETWALAHERRVPVLVHAGRGIPSLGAHAVQIATRYPGVRLILAHAGISDLAWIGRQAEALPNLYFDTSWWSPADLLTLFATVPPGQILFASDAPYGRTATAALGIVRIARQAGLDDDRIRLVLGEQMQRLLDGEEPLDGGRPSGSTRIAVDVLLDRVSAYLRASFGRHAAGASSVEMIGLARLACAVPADAPQADHCRVILELIDRYEQVVEEAAGRETAGVLPPGIFLLALGSTIARTPDVPVPHTLEF